MCGRIEENSRRYLKNQKYGLENEVNNNDFHIRIGLTGYLIKSFFDLHIASKSKYILYLIELRNSTIFFGCFLGEKTKQNKTEKHQLPVKQYGPFFSLSLPFLSFSFD